MHNRSLEHMRSACVRWMRGRKGPDARDWSSSFNLLPVTKQAHSRPAAITGTLGFKEQSLVISALLAEPLLPVRAHCQERIEELYFPNF